MTITKAVFLLLFSVAGLWADVITCDFSGTLTESFIAGVPAGAAFSGVFQYDNSAPANSVALDSTTYSSVIARISVDFFGSAIHFTTSSPLAQVTGRACYDPFTPLTGSQSCFSASTGNLGEPLLFFGGGGTLFDSSRALPALLPIPDFNEIHLAVDTKAANGLIHESWGYVTAFAAVPEAPSIVLLIAAVMMIVASSLFHPLQQ